MSGGFVPRTLLMIRWCLALVLVCWSCMAIFGGCFRRGKTAGWYLVFKVETVPMLFAFTRWNRHPTTSGCKWTTSFSRRLSFTACATSLVVPTSVRTLFLFPQDRLLSNTSHSSGKMSRSVPNPMALCPGWPRGLTAQSGSVCLMQRARRFLVCSVQGPSFRGMRITGATSSTGLRGSQSQRLSLFLSGQSPRSIGGIETTLGFYSLSLKRVAFVLASASCRRRVLWWGCMASVRLAVFSSCVLGFISSWSRQGPSGNDSENCHFGFLLRSTGSNFSCFWSSTGQECVPACCIRPDFGTGKITCRDKSLYLLGSCIRKGWKDERPVKLTFVILFVFPHTHGVWHLDLFKSVQPSVVDRRLLIPLRNPLRFSFSGFYFTEMGGKVRYREVVPNQALPTLWKVLPLNVGEPQRVGWLLCCSPQKGSERALSSLGLPGGPLDRCIAKKSQRLSVQMNGSCKNYAKPPGKVTSNIAFPTDVWQ